MSVTCAKSLDTATTSAMVKLLPSIASGDSVEDEGPRHSERTRSVHEGTGVAMLLSTKMRSRKLKSFAKKTPFY